MKYLHPLLPRVVLLFLLIGPPNRGGAADASTGAQRVDLPKLEFLDKDAEGHARTLAKITVPTVPDCVSMVWCYEGIFPQGTGEVLPDGSLVLRHNQGDMKAETVWTPLPNAVDVRFTVTGPLDQLERAVRSHLNPCWQHWPSKAFGNGGSYIDDYVPRCFIFTVRGMTRLNDTVRFAWVPDEALVADKNNPPWVQNYISPRLSHPGNSLGMRSVSTDRPILPIVGVVSHDGKWLQAWAWPLENGRLGQVWHDCLHPTPILRINPETRRIESHGKIYFMENDVNKLLAAYLADFGAVTAPALTLEAAGPALLVRSRDLPDNVLKLSLPKTLGGMALPDPAAVRWVKQPWGTFQAEVTSADKKTVCHVWAHPADDFVDLSITVVNHSPHLLTTTLEAEVDTRTAPALARKEASVALLLEAGANQKTEAGTLRVGTQIPGVIPESYRTIRGRLYFGREGNEQVQTKARDEVAEWQRAQPYLVAPPTRALR